MPVDRIQIRRSTRRVRRGFTVLELVVAGTVAVIVVGALSLSLAQLGRSRASTMKRLDAHMRANAALDSLRRDIASVLRSDDLFDTRVLITDESVGSFVGDLDRDELLIFSTRFAALRPNKYQGEGSEFETQYRIEEDELGAALWQRRDPVPDRWPDAGGLATPLVDGVVAVNFEAYDGEAWYADWDSDIYGLPWAIRATVTTVGQQNGDDPFSDPRNLVSLRTTIAIDRIIPPKEIESEEDKANEAIDAAEEALENAGGVPGGDGGVPGGPGDPVIGSPGGGGGGGRPDGPGGGGSGAGGGGGGVGGGGGSPGMGVNGPGPRGNSGRGVLSRGSRGNSGGNSSGRGGS